ncbi:MAG: hypothetical protein KJ630_05090 [Proteobacteria bacterium]|nr:hypothetical protein [Pseudomonadota bacterium]
MVRACGADGNSGIVRQSIDEVLLLFGQRKKSTRQKYREFVLDGIKHGHREDLVGGGLHRSQGVQNSGESAAYDERILSSGEFVESLWWKTETDEILVPKISIDGIMQKAAEMLDVKVELLRQRNKIKDLVDVRAAIYYLA